MRTRMPKPDADAARQVLAQRWFRALDHRRIDVGSQSWVALVTGVHMDHGNAWIQIADEGSLERSLVLHVFPSTTWEQAATSMRAMPNVGDLIPIVVDTGPVS